MKEAYAVRRTVPPSAEIQASIDKLMSRGLVDDPQKMLSELGRLGARLIIQRAVEEEFDQWLGRARYERRPERQRGLRNGFRPRHVQTAEGELRIEIPQAREAAMPFVSKLFPKWHCKRLLRTDPLKALVIGGFVRGLSMRDIESLCEEAGLGRTSKSTVATICAELHERFAAFCRRSLYDVNLVVLFLDAIYLPVRPSGPKEGVICAWGIDENGHRALVSVRLGARESKEDWLELGNGGQLTGAAYLDGNGFEQGFRLFCGIFVSYRPARRFGSGADFSAEGKGIQFDNSAVSLVVETFAHFVEFVDGLE
jgi:transposase-like protein